MVRLPLPLILGLVSIGCAPPPATPVAQELPAPQAGAQILTPLPAALTEGIQAGRHQLIEDAGLLRFADRARFDSGGEVVLTAGDSGGAEVRLATVGFGRAGKLADTTPGLPRSGACASARTDAVGGCLRRAETDLGAGLVEWWASDEQGLEQGWTVAQSPEGTGHLVIEVGVSGAEVQVAEAVAEFDTGAEIFTYAGLTAWDSSGRTLEAGLEATAGGLRVRVDDRDAVYPVYIDPLVTTAEWSTEPNTTSALFGFSVAAAGDVNGDSYDDVVVGAYGYSSSTGAAFVYLGSATGLSTTADATLDEASTVYYGYSVAGAGDVNNDGYDDVIIGEYGYSSSRGRAYVYHGSASGLSTTATTTITGAASSYQLGYAVASAGDVNGDGYDEVLVGAPGYSSSTGRAYLHLGTSSGVSSTATSTLSGASTTYYFGSALSSAGDLEQDGYDDVVVGSYGYSSSRGRVSVYSGSSSGLGATATSITGPSTSSSFGIAVAPAGDTDGDGYPDIIVGASAYSTNTGRAYIYRGSATGIGSSASNTLTGGTTSNYFGCSVAGLGDVDLDGYADVLVGAYGYSSSTGRAYFHPGTSTGPATTADTTLTGTASGGWFGRSVAGVGDVDGDGHTDLLIGSPYYDNGSTNEGAAWLFSRSLTLDSPDGGEEYAGGSTQTISWSTWGITDATSVELYYSTNGGSTYAYTIATGLSATDTSYSWTVPSLDSTTVRVQVSVQATSGDVTDSSTASFTVDSTAPTAFDLTTPTNGSYGDAEQTFDWANATGAETYTLWIDGVAVESGITTSTYTLTAAQGLTAGSHYWYVQALDGAGNIRQSTSTWTVITETTAPTAFSLVGPADTEWQTDTATFEWTSSSDADSGLSSYSLFVDGTACETGIAPTATTLAFSAMCDLEEGMHTWFMVAYDAVGNSTESTPSGGWTFGLDILAPSQLDYWDGSVGANDIADDDGISTDMTVAVGDHLLVTASGGWVFENGGSCSTSSPYYYTANGSGSCSSSSCPVTGCLFGSLVGRTGSGSWFCAGTSEDRIATTAGVLEFAANDNDQSNCSTRSISVVAYLYDVWEPTAPVDGDWLATNTPTFTWDAPTDSGSGVASYTLVIDGHDVATGITATTYTDTTALSEGDHEWYVTAVDNVGLDADSEEYTFEVDTLPPAAFSLDSPSDGDCSAYSTPTLCWDAAADAGSGLAGYDLYVDGALSSSVGASTLCATPLLSDGVHTWYVVATDDLGNARTSSQTWTISVGSTSAEVCDGVDNDCDGTYYGSTVDETSGGSVSTGSNRLRGNKVYVTTPSSLVSLQAYLSVSSGVTLSWTVYESATETGTYTRVATTSHTETTGSLGWKSSGPLPAVLSRNTYYVFVVGWTTSTSHYENASASFPQSITIGDVIGGASSSTGTPPSSSTFTTLTTAVDMRIVTGGESDGDDDGVVACDGDCDDTDPVIYTGATEACDGLDGDCDGLVPTDESDGDGDGMTGCAGDCDDTSVAVYLGATEACDRVDTDCDGVVPADEVDGDLDAYTACEGDCNDAVAAIYPAATEVVADGVDDDCDSVDACYTDADGDNFGTTTVIDGSSLDCVAGTGAAVATDCDDGMSAINPDATEVCDAADTDEDCDGSADDLDTSATGQSTFYVDSDGDGYGTTTTGAFCDQPAAYASNATDCDDGDAAYHPGAAESDCTDANDYNCDGSVAYADADADGYPACTDCDDLDAAFHPGASESNCSDASDYNCDGSVGYTDEDADGYAACEECDDASAATNPGAAEVPGDGIDEDCDATELCYVDVDADGYRPDDTTVASADLACDADGEAADTVESGDCDDEDPAYNPGADESDCTDPNDYNCDESVGYADADADGFPACTECDDADGAVNPDATEVCDGADNDCDGTTDLSASDGSIWYADADGDGYTDPAASTNACDEPAGYAAQTEDDCDDTDSASYPGADEVANDGVDQDCDGEDALEDGKDDTGDGTTKPGSCGCGATDQAPSFVLLGLLALTTARRRTGWLAPSLNSPPA